ncbi:MAG: pilin [Candidatus Gracilibacteria bacterium]|nr:pilin [Candidatus Gracilibacteria bacterium]
MKKSFAVAFLLLILGLGWSPVRAQAPNNNPARFERSEDFDGVLPSEDTNPALAEKIQTGDLHLDDVFIFIVKLIDLGAKIAGSIAVIFLLYGGFQLMISGVSDDKEKAKTTIRYALTGLAVTFLAWLIVYLIKYQMLGGG